MGIFDFRRRRQEKEVKKSIYRDWKRGITWASGPQHPLVRILKNAPSPDPSKNPRDSLDLYRLIWMALPFVQRASVIKSVLAGSISIDSGNDSVDRQINEWIKSVPIYNRVISARPRGNGLSQYYRLMRVIRDRDGISFGGERFAEDEGELLGLDIYDPAEFEYLEENNIEILRWTHETFSRDIEESPFFIEYIRRYMPEISWGLPITYGSEEFATNLITTIISNTNARRRFGNPLGMTFLEINAKELAEYAAAIDDDPSDIITEARNNLRDGLSEGLRSLDTQNPQEFIAAVPSGSVKTEVYGKGISPMAGVMDEIEFYSTQILVNMGVPPEFSGFFLGGGGIGSDKWQTLRGIFAAEIEAEQDEDRPHIEQNVINYATDAGIRLAKGGFQVIRSEPDTSDEKLQAESEKLAADAVAAQIVNMQTMRAEGLPLEAIQEYAEEIGRQLWMPNI